MQYQYFAVIPSRLFMMIGVFCMTIWSVSGCTRAASDFSKIKTTLDSFLSPAPADSGTVSGYSFAIVTAQGEVYRTAGGDIDADTVVLLASASKLPSAIAILSLVDSGKLDLDTPVGTYFSALDADFPWPHEKAAITMRMLLSHTAGIPSPPSPAATDCLVNEVQTLRSCAAKIATTPLSFPPGQVFSYSGADYQVAAYLATLLSGQSWQDFFASAVAQPLGLTSFTYGGGDNPDAAGSGRCSVSDYGKILSMLLNDGVAVSGRRLLSATAVAELRRDEIAGLPTANNPFPESEQPNYPGYTLSLWISASTLYSAAGSPGPEYSDPGLLGSTPWLDFGVGYGAVLLITQDTQTGLDIWNALRTPVIAAVQGN